MNKKEDLSPLNRALNRVAFVNYPRSVMFVNRDPDNDRIVRLVGAGNMNRHDYAPGFRIDERRMLRDGRPLAMTTKLSWEPDTGDLDADSLMAAKPTASKRKDVDVACTAVGGGTDGRHRGEAPGR